MANKYKSVFKSSTLSLSLGHDGYWLYDYTRGMNLSMAAKTEQEAFVEALTYYQKRLAFVEKELKETKTKIFGFISEFVSDYEEKDNF